MSRFYRNGSMRAIGVLATAFVVASCANKDFLPPRSAVSSKIVLQLTTVGQQQLSFTPKYLLVVAAYQAENDIEPLNFKYVPYQTGSQNVTIPVDLAPCLALNAGKSKDGCEMYVGAALTLDTLGLTSQDGDPFKMSFDYAIVGPFVVAPGVNPTIPAIDLSASRFSIVSLEGDAALRIGGDLTPQAGFQGFFGANPGTGVVSGTGTPILFSIAQGQVYPLPTTPQFVPTYPQLVAFQNGTWKRFTATAAPQQSNFTDVTALSASEVYIASPSGLWKFDGSNIARVNNIGDSLFAVSSTTSATAGKFAIAGGAAGVVWLGNTTTWTRYTVPSTQRIDGVCITGANEAFASSSQGGGLFRFDGTTWTSVPATNATANKIDLQCTGPGQAFVINGSSPLLRWAGTGWTTLPQTGLGTGRQLHWSVTSANEIYAYGDSSLTNRAFYRFNGTSWTEVGRTRFLQGNGRMWSDPRGGAAYAFSASGRVEQVTSNGVSVISYQPGMRDVAVNSSSSAFVVGQNMFLGRWDGARWNVDAPPSNTRTNRVLQGVWSDGPLNAWTVGSASTVLRYASGGWTAVSDSLKPIGTSDNYNAVWGAGGDVWAVGDASILHCKSATNCVNESSGGGGALYSVWGSSASNVFAVGAGGRIARFNGTSWSTMTTLGRTLLRVSGSGAGDIWAVGDSILAHYDGANWKTIPFDEDLQFTQPFFRGNFFGGTIQNAFQVGLWVKSPKEAYFAADNWRMLRWDGDRWRDFNQIDNRRRILGIGGSSGGCVLAIGDGQTDQPTPTLYRGLGASGCFNSPMAAPTSWP